MKLFSHYVITRFNLPLFSQLRDGHKAKALEVDYLNERLNIFCKYTLPSLRNQTVQDFKWLVLFDINTPQVIKEKLSNIAKQYDRFIPCYLDVERYGKEDIPIEYINLYDEYYKVVGITKNEISSYSEYMQRIVIPAFVNDIISGFNDKSQFVITTRIDNDDMFAPKMIEDIQVRVNKEQESCCYNYLYGHQVIFKENILQKYYFPLNHYTTLVEENKKYLQTILYWNHVYLHRFTNYREITCQPMWAELVHESNVSNKFIYHRNNKFLFNASSLSEYPMLVFFSVDKYRTIKKMLRYSLPVRVLLKIKRLVYTNNVL